MVFVVVIQLHIEKNDISSDNFFDIVKFLRKMFPTHPYLDLRVLSLFKGVMKFSFCFYFFVYSFYFGEKATSGILARLKKVPVRIQKEIGYRFLRVADLGQI